MLSRPQHVPAAGQAGKLAPSVSAELRNFLTSQRLAAAAADAVLHARNQGRKSCRRKRGIRRGMKDTPWKPGRRSAVTFQVRKHFRTLLDHRMEGLLRWRLAAQALIEAGEKIVHSGTMPCERLWANFSSLLPQENRLM